MGKTRYEVGTARKPRVGCALSSASPRYHNYHVLRIILERSMHIRYMKVTSMRMFISLSILLMLLSSCSATRNNQELIGKWTSRTSSASFIFHEDSTFAFDQPERPIMKGRYYALQDTEDLSNAQFDLEKIGIRFLPDGSAFYIYVDGAGGELFYKADQQS